MPQISIKTFRTCFPCLLYLLFLCTAALVNYIFLALPEGCTTQGDAKKTETDTAAVKLQSNFSKRCSRKRFRPRLRKFPFAEV